MKAVVHHADAVEHMRGLEAASVDSVVTDPPYGLEFMGRQWDSFKDARARGVGAGLTTAGFKEGNGYTGRATPSYGKRWKLRRCRTCSHMQGGGSPCRCDRPDWETVVEQGTQKSALAFQEFCFQWATEAFRVLKPGGHLLSFGSTRTSHRMAAGVEDAGFEIRDTIHWTFGSGFPKSLNLDGAWKGWGTALKPAHEHVVLARKPLQGTVAANVQRHGTGALNVDACRVAGTKPATTRGAGGQHSALSPIARHGSVEDDGLGRWPPNFVLTHAAECRRVGVKVVRGDGHAPKNPGQSPLWGGEGGGLNGREQEERAWDNEVVPDFECAQGCPVALLDQQSGVLKSGDVRDGVLRRGSDKTRTVYGSFAPQEVETPPIYADEGGASRFYPVTEWAEDDFAWLPFVYEAKASRSEREAGCEGLPPRLAPETVGRDPDSAGSRNPRAGAAAGAGAKRYKCGACGLSLAGGRAATTCPDDRQHVPQEAGEGSAVRNHHPTVKPIALMEWLVRLVTPPGGLVLDPFAGSGTTGCAAVRQGYRFAGTELDPDYVRVARARLKYHSQPILDGVPRPERSLADFIDQETTP